MKTPATILFVIGTLDIGGTERQLVRLATRLDRRRFRPVVCCLTSDGPLRAPLEAAGVPVEVVGFRGLTIFRHPVAVCRQLAQLTGAMRRHRPVIVHSFLFWAYILGTFAARAARVPFILTSRRGLDHAKARKPHYLALERLANRLTDLVVANSQAVAAHAVYAEGLPPSKVRVIYNGVDPAEFPPRPPQTVGSVVQIGCLANLIAYKGHLDLVEAAATVCAARPAVRVLLAGEGPMRKAIATRIRSLGLESRVTLDGLVPDGPAWLRTLDAFVLPSREEGFPNALLEAMATGLPTVATDVGGVPEVLTDRVTGRLVPPQDPAALAAALNDLLADPGGAACLGAAARERVLARFTLDQTVAALEALYTSVLEKAEPLRGAPAVGVTVAW